MGKLPDDIAAGYKSLVVLCDLSWWPPQEYCHLYAALQNYYTAHTLFCGSL